MKRVMSPKSLLNLKKEKPKHRDYGARYTVPQEKLDEIFSLLVKNLSLKAVSKKANVHFTTVKKYYTKGDPKRGIEPLRTRVMMYYKQRNQRFEKELLDREKQHLTYVRNTQRFIMDEIKVGGADYKVADLIKLIRLEREMMGAEPGDADEGILSAEEIRGLEGQAASSDQGIPQMQRR